MQQGDMQIRSMTRLEVEEAIAWAAAEGWNPGLHDADCFYAADAGGFLAGWLGKELIATISAIQYGSSFGFLGFYIVKPTYRGQGYGLRLWNAALERLQNRTIGLDGVVAQQENYQKSGFTLAYRNIRYQGMGGGNAPEGVDIVPLSTLPFEHVQDYDRPFFPDDRTPFLRCWINQPDSAAIGIRHHGELAGYGVVRPCQSGYKIGPLFADASELAEALFLSLQSHVPTGATIYWDTPEVNAAAVALAERYEMGIVFETARMYKGPSPELPLNRLFGVTSFELG